MKQVVLILALVLGAAKVSAQFFTPYCPYVPDMSEIWLDQMRNQQFAQMRAQTMAMQMQTMQMLQARAAEATYSLMNYQYNPTVPSAPVQATTTVTTREKVTCSSCGGTGRVTRNKPSYSQKCMVTVREICSECHGKGYSRE